MIYAPPLKYHQTMRPVTAIDGAHMSLTLSGPATGRTVVIFEEPARRQESYDILRERLHLAMFRVAGIPAHNGMDEKSVISFLDQLKITGALLVGDRAGGELAWDMAAGYGERFAGLVAIDCGHPKVPDVDGIVRDEGCPNVELDTTILVSSRAAHSVARASRRHVRAEFRLAELAGPRNSRHFTAQLATEIVVRALSR
jgi:pimeloyl-ACP methyl ester carboxylesterase